MSKILLRNIIPTLLSWKSIITVGIRTIISDSLTSLNENITLIKCNAIIFNAPNRNADVKLNVNPEFITNMKSNRIVLTISNNPAIVTDLLSMFLIVFND